jgi:hypothetical protein
VADTVLGEFFGKVSGAAITMRAKHVDESILKSRKIERDLAKLEKQVMAKMNN